MAATILIVDDEPDIRELIGEILADEDYVPVLASCAAEARERRVESDPDLILLDVWMPDSDGISLLREWREQDVPLCPVIMISGHGSVEAAVEATRYGASDFIEKPVSMARLLNTVRKALAGGRDSAAASATQAQAGDLPEPLGRSAAVSALRERLSAIESGQGNVLVSGEAGSGRSTLAHWIHARSPAAGATLYEFACGPGDSQLARLENAANEPATLILDQFEALGEQDRVRLNRLLARTSSPIRVIAVATPGLEQQAAAGRFDNALYQRVAESVLEVPALRERREDIPELVRYLAEQLPVRENLPYRPVPVPVQNQLRQHDWPGNLRELANLLRRLLQAGSEAPVEPDEVTALLKRGDPDNASARATETGLSPLFDLPLREAREAFERQYLIDRLRRADGSVGQLAEAVEMERTHLYRKLRQLGIDPKQVQEESE